MPQVRTLWEVPRFRKARRGAGWETTWLRGSGTRGRQGKEQACVCVGGWFQLLVIQLQVPYSSNMVLLRASERPQGGQTSEDTCLQVGQVPLLGPFLDVRSGCDFWSRGREVRLVKSPDLFHPGRFFFFPLY